MLHVVKSNLPDIRAIAGSYDKVHAHIGSSNHAIFSFSENNEL